MKDYSFGEDKDFILGYEKEDGKIIVKYASGGTLSFAYTGENEIKILNIMKEQVIKYHGNGWKIRENIESFSRMTIASVVGMALSVGLWYWGITIIGIIGISLATLGLVLGAVGTMTFKEELADFRKNNFFVDNEEKITKMIKQNAESLDKTMIESKTAEMYNKLDRLELTLNTIDKFSLKDLERILESIKRSESLGVQSADAFEQTLEVFQKSKKKEKIKRKIK